MAANVGAKGETRAKVRRLYRNGVRNPRQIAAALGITTQQVYMHLERLREAGELREPKSKARAS